MLGRFLLALLLLVVAPHLRAQAADVLFNNGLTPPAVSNVFDDSTNAADVLWIRNVGCPPSGKVFDPCPSPGTATHVAMRVGGEAEGLIAYDTSHIEMSGGTLSSNDLAAYGSATASLSGGVVGGQVYTYNDALITITGGLVSNVVISFYASTIEIYRGALATDVIAMMNSQVHMWGAALLGDYLVADAATITLYGDDFEVDGIPVAFGDLQVNAGQATGRLTGFISSGDVVDNDFNIMGGGKIILVETCIGGDLDGDGYGVIAACGVPGGDCNDADIDMFPGNPEVCDGKDNDCSGGIDEGFDVDVDGDGYAAGAGCALPGNDCNDSDSDIFPGNPEVCDGKDNDCNLGAEDGLDPDLDGDGYTSAVGCLLPGNDCVDTDAAIFPGNPEVCDGKDNDCSLLSDDGLDPDLDGDGYTSAAGCLLPGNDCVDTDAVIFPGNPEVCDGKDNDCNLVPDDGLDPDLDGDGYASTLGCNLPGGDCNDADSAIFPGNPEVCDGKDNDCSLLSDDGLDPDLDGDGYTSAAGCLLPGNDCVDTDAVIFPGNPEVCDGKDNDCTGGADSGLDPDLDGDGYTSATGCLLPGDDCVDTDAVIFPGNPEVCDGKDNDCSLVSDDGLDPDLDADGYASTTGCLLPGDDCVDTDPAVFPGNPEVCDGKDNDCSAGVDDGFDPDLDSDGYTSATGCLLPGDDCNDMDATIHPGHVELCDGKDNDCNLASDDGLDLDLDADGYSTGAGCSLPGGDCDDADAVVYPGNPEVCDGKDNDCNLASDDGLDPDLDTDGYTSAAGCLLPGADCNDADATMFPGNPEVCDGKDNDCNLASDDGLDPDLDSDGYASTLGCLLPGDDCNDADAAIFPGNPEVCDGKDNDCNLASDDGLDPDLDTDGYTSAAGCLLPGADCDDADATMFPGNPEVCDGKDNDCNASTDEGLDIDVDADGVALGTGCLLPSDDCDDADPLNFPGNSEACDGQDNNCDLVSDEGLDPDLDADGYTSATGCLLPGADCDDADATMFPGNPEVCDSKDNDCNASVDDGIDVDVDADGVALGVGCLLPSNDCDDTDPLNYPGNSEVCDGQDNDCSLLSDDGLDFDLDADGYVAGPGCLLPGADCDDADLDVFPGNPEVCDGKDNDCDGGIDNIALCGTLVPATSPTGFVALALLLTSVGLLTGLRRTQLG